MIDELADNEVQCPHCGNIANLTGLIGAHSNDCPRCGERVIYAPKETGSHYWRTGGREYYRNKSGTCEDAPCCGCCNA